MVILRWLQQYGSIGTKTVIFQILEKLMILELLLLFLMMLPLLLLLLFFLLCIPELCIVPALRQ